MMNLRFIKKLGQGDRKVITMIYQGEIGQIIRRMVVKNGGSKSEADDVLFQAIFRVIKLIQQGKYIHEEKFSAFIFGVAKNIWKEERRKKASYQKRHIQVSGDWSGILANPPTSQEDLGESMFNMKRKSLLYRAISQLKAREQKLIKLYYLEGYDLVEISEIMHLKGSYANVLHHRILKRLKVLVATLTKTDNINPD